MGLVAATRITAYYNEDLSRDMAKTIPFALLGIMIIDYTSVNMQLRVQDLDGDFAFVLYDKLNQLIITGRDPVGLKPRASTFRGQ